MCDKNLLFQFVFRLVSSSSQILSLRRRFFTRTERDEMHHVRKGLIRHKSDLTWKEGAPTRWTSISPIHTTSTLSRPWPRTHFYLKHRRSYTPWDEKTLLDLQNTLSRMTLLWTPFSKGITVHLQVHETNCGSILNPPTHRSDTL